METPEWIRCLAAILDGDDLSESQRDELTAALDRTENQAAIRDWLLLEQALTDSLGGPDADRMALSRERLLGKAALRAKGKILRARKRRKRRQRRCILAAAVVAVSLFAFWFVVRRPPAVRISGTCEILGTGELCRGMRVRTAETSVELTFGGYCRVTLAPQSELTWQGQPGDEVILLHRGAVDSVVDPGRGAFAVKTKHGVARVIGTRFLVRLSRTPLGSERMIVQVSAGQVSVTNDAGTRRLAAGEQAVFVSPGFGQAPRAVAPPEKPAEESPVALEDYAQSLTPEERRIWDWADAALTGQQQVLQQMLAQLPDAKGAAAEAAAAVQANNLAARRKLQQTSDAEEDLKERAQAARQIVQTTTANNLVVLERLQVRLPDSSRPAVEHASEKIRNLRRKSMENKRPAVVPRPPPIPRVPAPTPQIPSIPRIGR